MQQELKGIIPPMTTPFKDNGDIDEASFKEEVRYMLSANVHGLAVGGSTGEGHTLATSEFSRLIEIALSEVGDRIPVIAGIIADSTRQVVEKGKAVQDQGVAALQITPVHYLFTPNEEETFDYYASIAREVGLPIIIYNVVPWTYVSPALLKRIITEVDQVIGVKQSGGDMHALAELLLILEGRGQVFAAVDDLLYPCFALGSHGAIAAILTALPELCVSLWDAVKGGEDEKALALHERILKVWMAISGPNLPAGVKAAMKLQGRRGESPRLPMKPVSQAEEKAIASALKAAGVI